jgi:hypothetical protein
MDLAAVSRQASTGPRLPAIEVADTGSQQIVFQRFWVIVGARAGAHSEAPSTGSRAECLAKLSRGRVAGNGDSAVSRADGTLHRY